MTGSEFVRLKSRVQACLTAYGEISVDTCIRQMCDIVIGNGESITPYQLAGLMQIAQDAAEHNMRVYDKLIAYAKGEKG